MASQKMVATQSISKRKGIMKITKTIKAAALAALAVMTVSCGEDIRPGSSKSIIFNVKTAAPVETKSSEVETLESVDLSFNDMKITMTATAEPNYNNPFESYSTKGSMIQSVDALDSFFMNIEGLQDGANVLKGTDGAWSLDYTDQEHYIWPSTRPVNFDSYYSQVAGSLTVSNGVATYTSTASEASSTGDVLVGRTIASQNDVPVTLYHPLSVLKFKVAGLPGEGLKVKITVTGIYMNGELILPTEAGATQKALELSSGFEPTGRDNGELSTNVMANGDEECMFVVPQTAEGVKLSVNFTNAAGLNETKEIDFPVNGLTDNKWAAGYYYTYTISGGGYVDVEVSDFGENNAVTVKNTGSLPAYVRATVVCNYKNSGVIVAPWNGDKSIDSAWTENSTDGFYYITIPVGETKTFITSLTEGTVPDGATLNKRVLVQAAEENVWSN